MLYDEIVRSAGEQRAFEDAGMPFYGMLGKPTPGYEIDYVVPHVLGEEITTPWTGGIVR